VGINSWREPQGIEEKGTIAEGIAIADAAMIAGLEKYLKKKSRRETVVST
jgi:hypothetical protein